MKKKIYKIRYVGGSQAGVVGLLTILACGYEIVSAKSYYKPLTKLLKHFKIPRHGKNADVLICVHGREVIKKFPQLGGYNVHPYLSKYKGADPIKRAIKNNNDPLLRYFVNGGNFIFFSEYR